MQFVLCPHRHWSITSAFWASKQAMTCSVKHVLSVGARSLESRTGANCHHVRSSQFDRTCMFATVLSACSIGLQINKVFQQFVKRVQQDVWERDFG